MRAKGHHGRISISCRLDVDSRLLKCPLRTGLVPRGSDMCARHKSTQFWTSGLFVPPMHVHVGSQAAGSGRLGFSTQGLGSVTRQGDPRQCVTDPTNAEQTASCFVHVIARNSNSARPYPNRQRSWAGRPQCWRERALGMPQATIVHRHAPSHHKLHMHIRR